MKTKNLFVLAASMILLASCGGTPTPAESSASASASQSASASSSSSRTRSSSSSTVPSTPSEASLPDTLPVIEGTEISYVEGLRSGGESDARANPGFLYECHVDGGEVSGFNYRNGEYSFNYSVGWAWYGVQLFYVLPYSQANDAYHVRLRLYTDIAGDITINGTVYSLVWGWNVINYDVTAAFDNSCVISMQLGVNGGEVLGGSFIKMKDIEVYDAVNTYHKVNFRVGEKVSKSISVRAGQKATAPVATPPNGKILKGWYNDDVYFNPTAPVTAAATYDAIFVDPAEVETYNVTIKHGEATVTTVVGVKGSPIYLEAVQSPFGYKTDAYCTDANLETEYSYAPLTADTTLYVDAHVAPTTYYLDGQVARVERRGENGEFIVEFHNHGFDASWNIQVNFGPIPAGQLGKTYRISCEYTLVNASQTGAYQVYDGKTVGTPGPGTLEQSETFQTASVEFEGGLLSSGNKFTMELGLVHPAAPGDDSVVVFTVRNPKVVEVA